MEVSGESDVPAAFSPQEVNPSTMEQEAEWVSELVWAM
jgi:hypothetical protein